MMFGMTFEDEQRVHEKIAFAILVQSLPIFLLLYFVIPAPWGKTISYSFGPLFPARLSWFLFESPNLVWCYLCWSRRRIDMEVANQLLLGLFFLHYVQRAVLYPLFMSSNTTRMPLTVVVAAFTFCLFNGYVQAQAFCQFVSFPHQWHMHPQFLAGVALFATGAAINLRADATLRRLRALSPVKRTVPFGGLFDYVSAPHYLGEILEWTGFCIACNCSLPSVAFCVYTVANLIPRGVTHHAWYRTNFPTTYPRNRKAVFPFFW